MTLSGDAEWPKVADPMIEAKLVLDHGVGHSLLLLYDAKVPRGQKNKEFNDLGHDLSNTSISLFYIMTKHLVVYLHPADNYHRLTRPTFTGAKRPR